MKKIVIYLLVFFIVGNQYHIAYGSSDWTIHTSTDIGTHAWITQKGLENISYNEEDYESYLFLISNQVDLLYFVDRPDQVENDFMTFQGHFYNPHTGLNWVNKSKPTALSRFIKHTLQGVKDYEKNRSRKALKHFGYALHYLEDSCVPHHSKNYIAGFTWHTAFESYSNKIKDNHALKNIKVKNNWSESFLEDISAILYNCSAQAYLLADLADQSLLSFEIGYGEWVTLPCFEGRIYNSKVPDCIAWEKAAKNSLENAQKAVTQYLTRLVIEIKKQKNEKL